MGHRKKLLLCCFYLCLDVSTEGTIAARQLTLKVRYFRHYLNFRILWSVWYEYDLAPYVCTAISNHNAYVLIFCSESTKVWRAVHGTYLAPWMRYQIFLALGVLQLLNLFWYYLMMRILVRSVERNVLLYNY